MSEEAVREPYQFQGLPITPLVMRNLVPEVTTAGEVVLRGELLRRVTERHELLGGAPSAANPTSQIKKCLQEMAKAGEVIKLPGYGYWQVLTAVMEQAEEDGADCGTAMAACVEERFEVKNESGKGTGSVYAYYFPGYWREDERFPIKIGMSVGDVHGRIATQIGTSSPEAPIVHRVHHTDAPGLLERYLHSALALLGHWMEDAPGSEWFLTTPDEIDALLRQVGQLE